jgi:hypothetical protein
MLMERNPGTLLGFIAVATPIYVAPAMTMMQVDQVHHSSAMPGLMIATLMLGGGMTLGTISMFGRTFGLRAGAAFFVLLVALSALGSVALDKIAYTGVPPTEDTHAFDSYGQPFHITRGDSLLQGIAFRLQKEGSLGTAQVIGVIGLAILGLLSLLKPMLPSIHSLGAVRVPRWALVASAGILLPIAVYTLALSFYAPPDVLYSEFRAAHAEWMIARQLDRPSEVNACSQRMKRVLNRIAMSHALRDFSLDTRRRQAVQAVQRSFATLQDTSPTDPSWLPRNQELRSLMQNLSRSQTRGG